jgi:hypothetical protein
VTLFTSDTKNHAKVALIYLILSIFLALFGAVYEHFSFGVYSYFMLYALLHDSGLVSKYSLIRRNAVDPTQD